MDLSSATPIIDQMQVLIQSWDDSGDDKALFLQCYQMMTGNVLSAIERDEFYDSAWVNQLLHLFADYYFHALRAYEQNSLTTPSVWQLAHQATSDPKVSALQKILLGINAHINYDLVLTLDDLLRSEWRDISEAQRTQRYQDHCHINEIIGQTIDEVQDQILEPAMPFMVKVDQLLGPIDEFIISHLITHWREIVWLNATDLLSTNEPAKKKSRIKQIEKETLEIGKLIYPKLNG
jgi:hypothetical protein